MASSDKQQVHVCKHPASLVGVIDEGTETVSFSIFTAPEFKEIAVYREPLTVMSPQDGWYEQDPLEIMSTINKCAENAIAKLTPLGYATKDIITLGISNQRETTIAWDSITGKPLYNAIVWKDIRTSSTVDNLMSGGCCKTKVNDQDQYKKTTGLPISTYFSALKMRWLIDNVHEVQHACSKGRCKFGTVDSWIVWNLTNGALHITDVTNASRTLLMNLDTLSWEPELLKLFKIKETMLPNIHSCAEIFGKVSLHYSVLNGMTISGIIGNQQASLLGQMCIKPGQTKNTYRSGCFLLCNTGERPVYSRHGMLTTVAYQLGPKAPVIYALEGSVSVAGHALSWLHKKFRILAKEEDAEASANEVSTTGGVYFVPAFTGLYAPYWNQNARGLIIGITQFTRKNHIVRAALESICFQTRDILECMHRECGFEPSKLYADGTLTSNNLLMQMQADIAGIDLIRSPFEDTTALGAALCASKAEGIKLCKFHSDKRPSENLNYAKFTPKWSQSERETVYAKWKRAIERSLGWVIKH